tara:strand:- start:1 stop:216 length:216 start_codon:yes stop_codon:yes gene_type:complete
MDRNVMTEYRNGIMVGQPVCDMVDSHKEHKQAENQFYDAMFEGDEVKMTDAKKGMDYYGEFDGTCPKYPGF